MESPKRNPRAALLKTDGPPMGRRCHGRLETCATGLLLLLALLLLPARETAATTRTVTTLADGGAGSLRERIAASVDGDTINFAVIGTIVLTSGELLLGRSLTITGPGANVLTVSGNNASRVFEIATTVTVNISGLTISGGVAAGANAAPPSSLAGSGGGILNKGTLALHNCTISGNGASGGHGSTALKQGGEASGGGIYNNGTLALTACLVHGNVATGGNGAHGGSVSGGGGGGGRSVSGGIANQGTLALTNCTFNNNSSYGGNGGGTADPNVGGNGGSSDGGALWSAGINVLVINCTINGNYSSGGNGGFVAGGGGDGVGGAARGGGVSVSGPLTTKNTIIAGNTVAGGPGTANDTTSGPDVDGAVISQGHNLIGKTDGSSGWIASDLTGTSAAPLDPNVGPLQNNGGPTPTMALLPTSAAIDAGDDAVLGPPYNLGTDQRGQPRQIGDHVDIGAYEFGDTKLVTTLSDSGAGSLRGAVTTANPFDRIIFAPVVRGKIRLTSELFINKPLSIVGPGAAQLAISGNNTSRIFRIGPQGIVDLYGLTITEGQTRGPSFGLPGVDGQPGVGGGIYNEGTLALCDCMITTNRTQGGRGGDGQVGGTAVTPGNGGFARGGAIYSSGILSLTRCTLLGNVAQGGDGGGGGRNQFFTAFGNGGVGRTAYGGGIWSSGGPMRLENCTLSDNHARGGSGGLPWPLSDATPGRGGHGIGGALSGAFALESCSLGRNSASGGLSPDPSLAGAGTGGGAGSEFQSPSSARNSLIAHNAVSGNPSSSAPDVADAQSITPWLSLGWNLIGITDGSSGWTPNDFLGNNTFPLNPLLGTCQDNGGPVWTICPLAGSPARDKGYSDLATDARGGRRILDFSNLPNAPGGNGSDIGALEVDSLFRILSITKINATARVSFKTDPGNTYTLQQTSVVTNRIWTNVVSVAGNGQVAEAVDAAATARHRFYRAGSDASAVVQCAPPPGGLVSWWRAEGDASDRAGLNPGTLVNGPNFAAGRVGQAFNFTADGQAVTVPAAASLNVGEGFGLTVEGWINPAQATTQLPMVEWNSGAHFWISVYYAGFGGPGSIYATLSSDVNTIFATGPGVIQPGVWQHIAMTYDKASGFGRLYRNGVQVASSNLGQRVPQTATNLHLGARPGGLSFRGQLDEFTVYNRALTEAELLAIFNSDSAGKCLSP